MTPNRTKRGGSSSGGWEKVATQQCNAWLKRMLHRLDGVVVTGYTFHGTRTVGALAALAAGRNIEAINKAHGWKDKSEESRSYARLVQAWHMVQEPVLRDSISSTLQDDYKAFFKP